MAMSKDEMKKFIDTLNEDDFKKLEKEVKSLMEKQRDFKNGVKYAKGHYDQAFKNLANR